jgi:hypothetical protein
MRHISGWGGAQKARGMDGMHYSGLGRGLSLSLILAGMQVRECRGSVLRRLVLGCSADAGQSGMARRVRAGSVRKKSMSAVRPRRRSEMFKSLGS